VALAAVFLGEQIRAEQVLGGIVIVLGIFVARGGVRSRARMARA
jgi:drug/metabolite transporter (DMT)-like permease